MKLPKSFRPDKDLEAKTKKLVQGSEIKSSKNLDILVKSCEEFLREIRYEGYISKMYNIAEYMSHELTYDKEDLEKLVYDPPVNADFKDNIPGYRNLGLYFSALANKILKPKDEILFYINHDFDEIGANNDGAKIIVCGDVGNRTGWAMKSGEIIIKGKAGQFAGCSMQGGIIRISKHCGERTGFNMKDGEIYVEDYIKSVDEKGCKGTIYCRSIKIWP